MIETGRRGPEDDQMRSAMDRVAAMALMERAAVLVAEAGRLSGETDRLIQAAMSREIREALRHVRNAFDLAEHSAVDAVELCSEAAQEGKAKP